MNETTIATVPLLSAILICGHAAAQEAPPPPTSPPPAMGSGAAQEAPSPSVEAPKPSADAEAPPEAFIPTEQLSKDQGAAFPKDI